MSFDSTADTKRHIKLVQDALDQFTADLELRADFHDSSKLEEPEKSGIDQSRERLWEIGWGNEGYAELRWEAWGKHHAEVNDHHFEHFENGILGMNLMQLVEHFCDQYAACQTSPNGDILKSIEHHAATYGPVLTQIMLNTAKAYDVS